MSNLIAYLCFTWTLAAGLCARLAITRMWGA